MTTIKERLTELDEANQRMEAETEKMLAESVAFKAVHGGLSRTQLSPRFADRFANSNASGGGL